VILGGVGRIVAANELRRLVHSEHRIVLIERNRQHTFAPSFLWLMTGDRRPEEISRDVQQLVHKRVELLHGEVRGIDLAAHCVETSAGSVTYDLLIAVPPHRSPLVVRGAGLANQAGWVPIDSATLATKGESVYAIGDITAIPLLGRWKSDVPLMLPKAGVFAHAQALVVARGIADRIAGKAASHKFSGEGYCMLEAGEHLAGFASGQFLAEPSPQIKLRQIGRSWHFGKVLFEKWWLAAPGAKKKSLRLLMELGAKALRVPALI